MNNTFNDAIKHRRTYYSIGSDSPISDEKINEIVSEALTYVPSAFNCQSARTVVLYEDAHKRFWGFVMETLRSLMAAEKFAPTEEKINSFAAGHGTILFFDDTDTTKALMEAFPAYKQNFPIWAQQANGMLQYTVWTMLEDNGLGCSLQHYNPIIDKQILSVPEWDLNPHWELIAQMPFGIPTAEPGKKDTIPPAERMKIFTK